MNTKKVYTLGLHVELPFSVQPVLSDAQKTRHGRPRAVRPHDGHPDLARSRTEGGLSRHCELGSNKGVGRATGELQRDLVNL